MTIDQVIQQCRFAGYLAYANDGGVKAELNEWSDLLFQRNASTPTGWECSSVARTDSGLVQHPWRPVRRGGDIWAACALHSTYAPWSAYGLPNYTPNGPNPVGLPAGTIFIPKKEYA